MTYGTTLGEHLTIATSASIFYITIDYKQKQIWKYQSVI